MRNIVVLASGSGSLLQALIDDVANNYIYQIAAVVSDNPDSFALVRASRAGITTEIIEYEKTMCWQESLFSKVLSFEPDLVVSAGFMRIIKSDLFNKVPTINAHPSLLPEFPGAHAVADALAAGVSHTGASVHYVDQGVDTGRIIAQQQIEILPGDTEISLHERIKEVERKQLVEVVVKLCQQTDLWAGISK